jgi:hypothetical protein
MLISEEWKVSMSKEDFKCRNKEQFLHYKKNETT